VVVSTHTQKQIIKRSQIYWEKHQIWSESSSFEEEAQLINGFLEEEYNTIPSKERIGKGRYFIAKSVARGCRNFIETSSRIKCEDIFNNTANMLLFGEMRQMPSLVYLATTLMAEFARIDKGFLERALRHAKVWAEHENWEIRECTGYIIRLAVANNKAITFDILSDWISSPSPNLRRVVVESLRPLADIKWLRDPNKNDEVIAFLYLVRFDPSIYVRTSVGNNLKDLSKYMPDKILNIVLSWINESEIKIAPDLASKGLKELGRENYNLIWTIKHGLRWLQKREPRFHDQIREILGDNYVNYFDEKRNKLAKPK
jgi:3-methyladenine DNA glycosylase AlkC